MGCCAVRANTRAPGAVRTSHASSVICPGSPGPSPTTTISGAGRWTTIEPAGPGASSSSGRGGVVRGGGVRATDGEGGGGAAGEPGRDRPTTRDEARDRRRGREGGHRAPESTIERRRRRRRAQLLLQLRSASSRMIKFLAGDHESGVCIAPCIISNTPLPPPLLPSSSASQEGRPHPLPAPSPPLASRTTPSPPRRRRRRRAATRRASSPASALLPPLALGLLEFRQVLVEVLLLRPRDSVEELLHSLPVIALTPAVCSPRRTRRGRGTGSAEVAAKVLSSSSAAWKRRSRASTRAPSRASRRRSC